MIKPINVKPVSKELMKDIGFSWHTDKDGSDYVANEIIEVTEEEANRYYEAGNELYDMFVKAGEYVIENDLFHEIGVPFNLVDMIKKSWENDVHWHIYGRFDLAGGIDNKEIKLLEFNADTPTSLFETAIIQWATLKANNMNEDAQFNTLFQGLVDNFKRLITLNEDVEKFDEYYDGWKILFSSVKDNEEEEKSVKFLQMCANEAGFETSFCYLDEVVFDEENGIFDPDGNSYEYWFKLYPWEDIALEDDLALVLTKIMENQKAIILNPPYTVMFQSKGFLKILSDLFNDSPYILKTSFKPLEGMKYVKKKVFGREGANVTICNEDGSIIKKTDGEYEEYKTIFQEFVELAKNNDNDCYQAGLFFAYESIALGYRKGGMILDDFAKFVGHRIV